MPTNEVFHYPEIMSGIVCTSPALPAAGGPVRYGVMTGVALGAEGTMGNPALQCTVDFGLRVWTLPVTDGVGGGIAAGDALFYADGAPGTITNVSAANYFFGFALAVVGAGLTATIRVLHVPSPGAGTLGAGTVATANLAAGIISADAAGRALFAAGVFDVATALSAFAANSIANAFLLNAIADGAFQADAATRLLFADGIWTEAKLAANALTGTVAANVADANVIGGIPVVHRVDLADAAGDTDVVLTHKTRIIDVTVVKAGGAGQAGNTVKLVNVASGNDITDDIALTGADQTVARAGTIDDAEHEIAAGGTLRFTVAKAGANAAGIAYVHGVRVA